MHPALTAIQEAHLWTKGPAVRGAILVRHPNGVELSITRTKKGWSLRHYQQPPNLEWDGYNHLADIPKVSTETGFAAVQSDTIRIAGSDALARLNHALDKVAVWALGMPGHDSYVIIRRQEGSVFLSPRQFRVSMPPDLAADLRVLGGVLWADHEMGAMKSSDEMVQINLPKTAHGLLELRHRVQMPPIPA